MAGRDLYEILELPRGASVAEIKKAYKRLARKYHPDLNPKDKASEERFKEVSQAYAVLSNAESKKRYDACGDLEGASQPRGRGVNFEGFDFDAGSGAEGGFGDLFDAFFQTTRARGATGPEAGEDLVYPLSLSLQEAFHGKRERVSFRRRAPCAACHGSGKSPHSSQRPCSKCNGTGRAGFGKGGLHFSRPCQTCAGTGQDPGEACRTCGGSGHKEVSDAVEVAIPAGVDTGSRIRLKGKGQAGRRGGPPGDLYIETHILDHPRFKREGPNLSVKVAVTFPEAVLGGRIEVPTLSGGARLRIPPGTHSGQVFRLRERGMPSLRGGAPGDLLVEVVIVAPEIVDEHSKEILREFQRLNPENPRGESAEGRG